MHKLVDGSQEVANASGKFPLTKALKSTLGQQNPRQLIKPHIWICHAKRAGQQIGKFETSENPTSFTQSTPSIQFLLLLITPRARNLNYKYLIS